LIIYAVVDKTPRVYPWMNEPPIRYREFAT